MNLVATIPPIAARRAATRIRLPALAIALLVLGGTLRADASETVTEGSTPANTESLEYQLKAGFLFNFAKFVQWPATNGTPTNQFRIGIVDDGAVFPVISQALDSKTVNGRKVAVERLTRLRDAKNFNMVFVTKSQEGRIPALLNRVGNAPVLTVGESEGFAAAGGCINFIRQEHNVRFEINLEAAEEAGLKVSSKLASLAKVVTSEKEEE